ncbi:MAG: pilin [Parcubacteria group bacterium]|jgi:type IV secretory pathway VirB2 component (pilin)
MKKNIILLSIILLGFLIFGADKSLAYTESECTARGGGCSNSPCNGSANTIGGCDGSPAPYCCGDVSAATQKIFSEGGLNPATGSGSATGGGNLSVDFTNPIGWNSIEQVMNSLAGYLKGIAGTIAVIFIIIGGVMYMFAGANKDMAEKGKHTLTYAIAGLAIVIAAPTFLREIKTILGGDTSGIGGLSLLEIAGNVLRLLLSIVGMLAIIMMVIGGLWMFSATGNEKQFETGRNIVTYAIIGIAISIGSLVIAQQVARIVAG